MVGTPGNRYVVDMLHCSNFTAVKTFNAYLSIGQEGDSIVYKKEFMNRIQGMSIGVYWTFLIVTLDSYQIAESKIANFMKIIYLAANFKHVFTLAPQLVIIPKPQRNLLSCKRHKMFIFTCAFSRKRS